MRSWDYRGRGAYSITICTHGRDCLFGSIRDGQAILTELGQSVEQAWLEVPSHYSNAEVDVYAVMPNHFHGILRIVEEPDSSHDAEGERRFGNIQAKSVSSIVRAFKAGVTRNAGRRVWQDGFHEHIIRDEQDYWNHRRYIESNPANWGKDRNHPNS